MKTRDKIKLAETVRQNNERIPASDMDQIHLPDPIMDDIHVLQRENTELTNRVLELERELRLIQKNK